MRADPPPHSYTLPDKPKPAHRRTDPLLPHHRAELEKSGLDAAAIAAGGFYSESRPREVARLLGWDGSANPLGPCLVLPFPAADGSPSGYCQLKPDRPRERDGKPVKYESPKGKPSRVYLPPNARKVLADPAAPLIVTEGAKKAACADAHGLPCLGLVGVDNWSPKRPKGPDGKPQGPRLLSPDLAAVAWTGRPVAIVFDSDADTKEGVRWAEWRLAQTLTRAGARVTVVRLPAAADGSKQGLDDFVVANGADALGSLVAAAGPARRPERKRADGPDGPGGGKPTATGPAGGPDKARGPTAAELLVQIGRTYHLWHDADRRAYATLGRHTYRVKSTAFRQRLRAEFYRQAGGKVPAGEAEATALGMIEAAAVCDGPEDTAHVRVAGHGGRVFVDLADADATVIEVTADGWRPCPDPPVRFVRPEGLLPLPAPERGGDVAELRPFVNLSDDEFTLFLAWLDMAFNPAGPYPPAVNTGEQGSGKSTTGEVGKLLADPNKVTRRARPKAEDDLLIAAVRQRALLFDNMRELPDWLSDALCRLSTGGGFGKRTLYSDEDETVFNAVRPVILNGITDFADAPDLLDRALIFRHKKLPAGRRLTERRFWEAFEAARPRLLGALLDRAAGGLRALPGVDLADELPRMADFAEWAVACEVGAGGTGERFLAAYAANRRAAHELALDVSPVSAALVALMADREGWAGTPTDLLAALTPFAPDAKARDWPKAANKLTGWLRKLKPDLSRARGIDVNPDAKTADDRRWIVITATRPAKDRKQSSLSSGPSGAEPLPDGPDDRDDEKPSFTGRQAGGWRYGNDAREGWA